MAIPSIHHFEDVEQLAKRIPAQSSAAVEVEPTYSKSEDWRTSANS